MEPAATQNELRTIGGRYAVYDEIGSGGMARIHLGRVTGAAGFVRTVAIKRLHATLCHDSEFVAMFQAEVRLAARIRHPNVVQTLDVVAERGELFLVMEYILGEPLSLLQRIAERTGKLIPPWVVARIMVDLLQGLHAAHETKSERGVRLGLVHRDVSPQNVLLGADGVARVLDFGIAKSANVDLTARTGVVKGKLPYLAPEQILGEPVSVGTDIYGASVVFWELLTGKRLFDGDRPSSILARIIKGEVLPPSRVVPGLPAYYDDIVMRGLSRRASERFGSAEAMADVIETHAGVANRRDVARWFESVAGENLRRKTDQLTRIENRPDSLSLIRNADSEEPDVPSESTTRIIPTKPHLTEASDCSPKVAIDEPIPPRHHPLFRRLVIGLSAMVLLSGGVVALANSQDESNPSVLPRAPATTTSLGSKDGLPLASTSNRPTSPSEEPALVTPATTVKSTSAPMKTKKVRAAQGKPPVTSPRLNPASPFAELGGRR